MNLALRAPKDYLQCCFENLAFNENTLHMEACRHALQHQKPAKKRCRQLK